VLLHEDDMDALLWDHSINEDAKEVPQGLKPEEEVTRFTVCAVDPSAPTCATWSGLSNEEQLTMLMYRLMSTSVT
jgi:hypothetical protein